MNNNQNIFEILAQESSADEFIPIIKKEISSDFQSISNKNIFESLAEEAPNQSFSFLDIVKDIGQQVTSKGISGITGAYGNLLDTIGLQIKDNILPSQQERFKRAYDDPYDLGLEDDIAPPLTRLPTSKDVQKVIESTTGIGQGKTPAGRVAGRGAEFIGEGLAYPGGGAKALTALGLSGVAGQGLREIGAPEALAAGTEIVGSISPSIISKKLLPKSKEAKELVKAGRAIGLTEKEITPLIQSERKSVILSKIARKGESNKKLFESIKDNLGNSYQNIKTNVSKLGTVDPKNTNQLLNKFTNIREDLAKTVKPSPDKEAAIKFIDDSLEKIRRDGATPEELINFWQDINKSVKWNSIQGGKKSLTQLKEPILDVLQNVAPQAAKDFEMTNQLYSKYSQIAKKLKPNIVDAFVNKGEIMSVVPAGIALLHGNPWFFASLGGEVTTRYLAKEMLVNPYFQNLGNKLVHNFNQGSLKGVKDLMNNAKEFMERKYPNEEWSFLLVNDDEHK